VAWITRDGSVVSEGRPYGVEGLDLLGEVVDELFRGRVTGEHVFLEEEGLEQLLLLARRRGGRRKEEGGAHHTK
jgi:hypothetical protein